MYIGAFMYDVITEFFQTPPHPCLTSSTFLVAPAGWRRIAGSFFICYIFACSYQKVKIYIQFSDRYRLSYQQIMPF